MTRCCSPRKPRCSSIPLTTDIGRSALILLVSLLVASISMSGKADVLDPAALKRELRALSEQLRTVHPDAFAVISAQDFEALTSELASSIDSETTKEDQLWNFSRLLAAVGCGHTKLGFFNQEDSLISPEERFPVDVRFLKEKLFVIDPLVNRDRVAPGAEIRSINGISVTDLQRTIFDHISSDHHNPGAKTSYANAYASSYLTYALGYPESYVITIQGSDTATALLPLTTFQHKPVIDPASQCQETLCLDIDQEGLALMTIRNWDFYGERLAVFEKFVDDSFQTLLEKPVKALLIDVRGNLGGSGSASAYLLRHLAKSPFAYFAEHSAGNPALKRLLEPSAIRFDGPLFVLANGQTGSSTGHFLSLVKERGMATHIGFPSGAGSRVHDNKQQFRSEASGISYAIARSTFRAATPDLGATTAVEPDFTLTFTVDDLLAEQDAVLAKAQHLIRQQFVEDIAR